MRGFLLKFISYLIYSAFDLTRIIDAEKKAKNSKHTMTVRVIIFLDFINAKLTTTMPNCILFFDLYQKKQALIDSVIIYTK